MKDYNLLFCARKVFLVAGWAGTLISVLFLLQIIVLMINGDYNISDMFQSSVTWMLVSFYFHFLNAVTKAVLEIIARLRYLSDKEI